MVKLLHVSDTHLGYRQYRSDVRKADFQEAFEQVIDIATGDRVGPVDGVVHTGDLFDKSNVPIEDIHKCQEQLQRLSDDGIPFFCIVGNHERKLGTQFVDLYEDAGLATRLDETPTLVGDDVALYGIDAVKKRSWETTDFTLEKPGDERTVIVCMHHLLSPPIRTPAIAEYDSEEVIDRFGIDVDGLALGDYHKRVSDSVNDTLVWYPGSTERCSTTETENRSVDLLTVDEDIMRERVELDTREFCTVRINLNEGDSMDVVRRRVEDNLPFSDSVVVARLTGDNSIVSKRDVHSHISSHTDAAVVNVQDDRTLGVRAVSDDEKRGEARGLEETIEEQISSDHSPEVLEIEELVRNGNISKNQIRDRVGEIISGGNHDD